MAELQIDRMRAVVRHVSQEERKIAFTIEGTVPFDRVASLERLVGEIGDVTCSATFTMASEIAPTSPSILTEYLLVDDDRNLFAVVVTKDGMGDFIEGEHDGLTAGRTIYDRVADHYRRHHDKAFMAHITQLRKRQGEPCEAFPCGCPLIAIKLPRRYQSGLDIAGFTPWSFIEMVEAGTQIDQLGVVRRGYLNEMASKLRIDMGWPKDVENPTVI